jgi:hypothetical protein
MQEGHDGWELGVTALAQSQLGRGLGLISV